MATDPDVQLFLDQRRTAARRRMFLNLAGLLVFGVALAAAVFVLRPNPCERAADRICAYWPGPECAALRQALVNGGQPERCAEALHSLDVVDAMPRDTRIVAIGDVIEDVTASREAFRQFKEARDISEPLLADLDSVGTLTPAAKRGLASAPPSACLIYLARMRDKPSTRQVMHEVLVAMNETRDLGPDPEDWAAWCRQRAALNP